MKNSLLIIIIFLLTACSKYMTPQQAASKSLKCGRGSIR